MISRLPTLKEEAGAEVGAAVPMPAARERDQGAPPLDLIGVHKTWRKTKNAVLQGIDLTLEPGSLTWIGGRNGAGKTTLLRVAGGLIGAEEGHVLAFGLHARRDRREYQRRVALLSAGNTGMYARLTVQIQLDTWARIAFVERSRRAEEVERIVRAFALEEIIDSRCDRISMGQRQRVRIAMTFIGQPDLVLLDEPGTSLDEEGIAVLEAAINETVGRGGAVLWASPSGDRPGVEFSRRVMLEEGKLREL